MDISNDILSIEKIASILSPVAIDEVALDKVAILIQDMLDCTCNGYDDVSIKLSEVIREYVKKLNNYYDCKFYKFDNADDLDAFDIQYDIRIPIRDIDFKQIIVLALLYILLTKYGNEAYHQVAKKNTCNILGRFLALHYGTFMDYDAKQGSLNNHLHTIFHQYIKCLSLLNWNIEDSIYLKLAIYNLLDAIGDSSRNLINHTWKCVLDEINNSGLNLNEYAANIINECSEKYYKVLQTENIIAPLETTWHSAVIQKKRFGFISCKQIKKTATNSSYPFTYRATAICFKGLVDRVIGNGPKVVLFEKNIQRRSSEYIPIESSYLYNYSSMKFE